MAQAQTGSGTKPNSPTNAHRPQRSFVGDVPTSIAESVAERLKVAEGEFLGVAEAMPEEKYGFVPTSGKFDDARSFAEQGSTAGMPGQTPSLAFL